MIDAGLQSRRRPVASGMRRRTDSSRIAARRGGNRAVNAHVRGQGTIWLHITQISVAASQVDGRGHRHGALCWRGRSHRRAVKREVVAFRAGLGHSLGLGGCKSRCCFLDSAAVVILMAGQCGPAGESLLAVDIGALVRALPRVDPSVASQ